MQKQDETTGMSAALRRSLILVALIIVVTLFWVLMLLFTNLPTAALGVIAAVSIVLLSLATAWTATALPRPGSTDTVS